MKYVQTWFQIECPCHQHFFVPIGNQFKSHNKLKNFLPQEIEVECPNCGSQCLVREDRFMLHDNKTRTKRFPKSLKPIVGKPAHGPQTDQQYQLTQSLIAALNNLHNVAMSLKISAKKLVKKHQDQNWSKPIFQKELRQIQLAIRNFDDTKNDFSAD